MSSLPVAGFTEQWGEFARRYAEKSSSTTLLNQVQTRSRYSFISKHKWPEGDFQFSFMGKRKSDYFPERSVKVVQMGGFIKMTNGDEQPVTPYTVIAFLKHEEYDLDFYRKPGSFRSYNEYSAFYESCLYGYVFEYFTTEAMLPELLLHLKSKAENEIAVYQNALPKKKTPARLSRNVV